MSAVKLGPDHYRFVDRIGPNGVVIYCQRYVVVGETEQCYYVIEDGCASMWPDFIKKHRLRVLKRSYKRYCYPDLTEAMRSYKARKRWQLSHAKLAMARAESGYAEAERLIAFEGLSVESFPHQCEGGEYVKGLNWSEY